MFKKIISYLFFNNTYRNVQDWIKTEEKIGLYWQSYGKAEYFYRIKPLGVARRCNYCMYKFDKTLVESKKDDTFIKCFQCQKTTYTHNVFDRETLISKGGWSNDELNELKYLALYRQNKLTIDK